MAEGQHEKTISCAAFTRDLVAGEVYIAAIGSYSPDPDKMNRYTLYRETDSRIEWCRDAWLAAAEAEKLAELPNVYVGESDAMYAVDPRLVWYRRADRMRIYSEEKQIFDLLPDQVVLHGREIHRANIQKIHAYLEHGWDECGLRLVLRTEEILVACKDNGIASYDIFYDGLNLLVDTWWARALGRLLGEALGCPYEADEDLR